MQKVSEGGEEIEDGTLLTTCSKLQFARRNLGRLRAETDGSLRGGRDGLVPWMMRA